MRFVHQPGIICGRFALAICRQEGVNQAHPFQLTTVLEPKPLRWHKLAPRLRRAQRITCHSLSHWRRLGGEHSPGPTTARRRLDGHLRELGHHCDPRTRHRTRTGFSAGGRDRTDDVGSTISVPLATRRERPMVIAGRTLLHQESPTTMFYNPDVCELIELPGLKRCTRCDHRRSPESASSSKGPAHERTKKQSLGNASRVVSGRDRHRVHVAI